MRFLDIYVGATGSQHDSRVFSLSPLGLAQRSNIESPPIPFGRFLVADGAYPVCSYFLAPFDKTEIRNDKHAFYNNRQAQTRNPVERAFGN